MSHFDGKFRLARLVTVATLRMLIGESVGLRLFDRGADRATMIEAVTGVLITELAGETNAWLVHGKKAISIR